MDGLPSRLAIAIRQRSGILLTVIPGEFCDPIFLEPLRCLVSSIKPLCRRPLCDPEGLARWRTGLLLLSKELPGSLSGRVDFHSLQGFSGSRCPRRLGLYRIASLDWEVRGRARAEA